MGNGMKKAILFAIGLATAAHAVVSAQQIGSNINMARGTSLPGGDPYLQRQVETSLAVSSRNPCHLAAGVVDYKTVDYVDPQELPAEGTLQSSGDSWLGLYKSFDCGRTWIGDLLFGFPGDTRPGAARSVNTGFQAGADPIVRAGTNGMFYYAGLVLNRGANPKSQIFVAPLIDRNNKERGDPILQLDAVAVDTGTAGQFFDKPWLAVDLPRTGFGPQAEFWTATADSEHTNAQDATEPVYASYCEVDGQRFPGGNVYVAWARFEGSNTAIKMMFARSTDCGRTWKVRPISNNQTKSQGATIAIDYRDGTVYLFWRQFKSGNNKPDGLWFAKSTDGGATFSKPSSVAIPITPFDQLRNADPTGASLRFRTNALPSATVDSQGNVHVVLAGVASGQARIMRTVSTNGGKSWSTPAPIDPDLARPGHQFMPSITFAAGKLQVLFFDSQGNNNPPGPYVEGITQKVDVWTGQADPGAQPEFAFKKVSQYRNFVTDAGVSFSQSNRPNLPMYVQGTIPFIGDYLDLAALFATPVQHSPAFQEWVPNLGPVDSGASNTASTATAGGISPTPVFHGAWADNRDVVEPVPPLTWADYTAPVVGSSAPPGSTGQCPPTPGMRNANPYTFRADTGLFVGSTGNTKPLGKVTRDGVEQHIQRAFVVFVQNTTRQTKFYRLTVTQPGTAFGDRASFVQFPAPPYTAGPWPLVPLNDELRIQVSPISSHAVTVYVTANDPTAQVRVDVAELLKAAEDVVWPVKDGGLTGSVLLNPDRTNPVIEDPDFVNPTVPDIGDTEVHVPVVFQPLFTTIQTPIGTNQEIGNPGDTFSFSKEENPREGSPREGSPREGSPREGSPREGSAGLENTAVTDFADGDGNPRYRIKDFQFKVSNDSNTTSVYRFSPIVSSLIPGARYQLLVTQRYYQPVMDATTCQLVVSYQNQVLVNMVNFQPRTPREGSPREGSPREGSPREGSPREGSPREGSPREGSASFMMAPAETYTVTLRVYEPLSSTTVQVVDPAASSPAGTSVVVNAAAPSMSSSAPTLSDSTSSSYPGSGASSPVVASQQTSATDGDLPILFAPADSEAATSSSLSRLGVRAPPLGYASAVSAETEDPPPPEPIAEDVGAVLTSDAADTGETEVNSASAAVDLDITVPAPTVAPTHVIPGEEIEFSGTLTNRGTKNAIPSAPMGSIKTRLYLRQNPPPDPDHPSANDVPLTLIIDGLQRFVFEVPFLNACTETDVTTCVRTLSFAVQIPATALEGPYHIVVVTDEDGEIPSPEATYENNVAFIPFTVDHLNHGPVAVIDTATVAEDGFVEIFPVANDTDVDGDALTIHSVTQGAHGTVVPGVLGKVVYTPAADFFGSDQFTYTVCDNGTTGSPPVSDPKCAIATVEVTVTEVNDPPVPAPDSKSAFEDVPLTFAASDLTANDSPGPGNEGGEGGQTLTVTIVTADENTHGQVSLSLDGHVTYTPDSDYVGPASFAYEVCDNGTTNGGPDSKCAAGLVSVDVLDGVDIVTPSLPDGTTGVGYAETLEAAGGTAPYLWSVASGNLPAGLTLDPETGTIAGTPAMSGAFTFTIAVAESTSPSLADSQTFCIHIEDALTSLEITDLDHGRTASELAQSLLPVAGGVEIANVAFTGANQAAGAFDGGTSILGFESGIILGSGEVGSTAAEIKGVRGPNTSDSTSTILETPSDADLNELADGTTFDATVLEFDFKPTCPSVPCEVTFDYVFSSDEYNEFANTGFDDVFAFFVNGVNYARLPDGTRVSINTVNGGNPFGTNAQHPSFFRNNDLGDGGGSIDIEADGLTVVLHVVAPVTSGAWNHIKLAIADTSDQVYDSWVFIKGSSFRVVEICGNGVDDDGDGLDDGQDPDCHVCPVPEIPPDDLPE